MTKPMSRVEKITDFQQRAAESRQRAAQSIGLDMKTAFLRVAEEWERLAQALLDGYEG